MHDGLIYFDSCPAEEEATSTLDPDFARKNKAECLAYIRAIKRVCGIPPEGAALRIKEERGHDYGPYRIVTVTFDSSNTAAADYAHKVEEQAPATWSEAGMEPPHGRELRR